MNTEKILEQKIDQILENYKISSKRNASNFLRNNEILINSKKFQAELKNAIPTLQTSV